MREQEVWRKIVDWAKSEGYSVLAACPPGSSVYDYQRFCIVDTESGKRDEPDILMTKGDKIYFVECKTTKKDSLKVIEKAGMLESDVDKLIRIDKNAQRGIYNEQLAENYGLDCNGKEILMAIAYCQSDVPEEIEGIYQIVWDRESDEVRIF